MHSHHWHSAALVFLVLFFLSLIASGVFLLHWFGVVFVGGESV
jgi:hypothetical protein